MLELIKEKTLLFFHKLMTRRQAQAQQGPPRAGSYSVKGSSNKLIQMSQVRTHSSTGFTENHNGFKTQWYYLKLFCYQPDRSRRHLQPKKKPLRSRLGSFSLLDHNRETRPLQVRIHDNHDPSDLTTYIKICNHHCTVALSRYLFVMGALKKYV